jgi:hypothetical protein
MLRIQESPQYQLARLQEDSSRLHVLVPAGIGDVAWIGAKLFPIAHQRKNVTFHLPGLEQQRVGCYLDLFGIDYEYNDWLTTDMVWNNMAHPSGSPELPRAGCVYVQANRHLETGHRIEEWYPKLKTVWPVPEINHEDYAKRPFCLMFPGSRGYMGRNLSAADWVRVVGWLHRHIAPVRLVGAGQDAEFVQQIGGMVECTKLIDRPIEEVLAAATSPYCRLFLGVASGPLIAATYMGAPCFFGYPEHLHLMPGTWEQPGAKVVHCLLRDLPGRVRENNV